MQYFDDENRHDDAHHQRAAVADEHLRCFSEDVVEKERDQRPDRHHGQKRHFHIARQIEQRAEHHAGQDAEPRRESVHAVDQVDGVDDPHGRDDGQRNGYPSRDSADAP